MRKISYYLALLVLVGIGLVSFWIYQKYFKTEGKPIIAFQVVQSDLREAVNVRGEVASQKEFELEFPFGGTVERIFVKEGAVVKSGEVLMGLETKELELERARLQAILAQREASLAKLLGGAQMEDIRVSEAKVTAAEQVFHDAENTLLDAIRTSFTVADDAVHNKADQFFTNPRTQSPAFNQNLANTQLKTNLEANRVLVGNMLTEWGAAVRVDTARVTAQAERIRERLSVVRLFLLDLADAVNSLTSTGSATQTTIDAWKESVLSARTAIDGVITLVVNEEEKMRTAESAFALAQSELAFKESTPRSEDVKIAQGQIEETKNALALMDEKVRKSTLRAPGVGVVKKLLLEEKEIFKPGMTALVFASAGYKVQADVSELDIGKVRYVNGNDADVRFDAFPGKLFKGKVVFIEPKEILKNEDVYFRTNIFLDPLNGGTEIRSGMSVDVVLYGVIKKSVLVIPELAIKKRGGASFVDVAVGAAVREQVNPESLTERSVTTGVSDGELVEVVTGLSEGEIVVVSAD